MISELEHSSSLSPGRCAGRVAPGMALHQKQPWDHLAAPRTSHWEGEVRYRPYLIKLLPPKFTACAFKKCSWAGLFYCKKAGEICRLTGVTEALGNTCGIACKYFRYRNSRVYSVTRYTAWLCWKKY